METQNAQELLRKGQILLAEGKDKESIETFTQALEAGADPYISYISRGAGFMKMRDVDSALGDFTNALRFNQRSARAYFFRGVAYLLKNEFERAVSDFTSALEFKKDYGIARFCRAISNARMGNFDASAQDMKIVLPEMEANLQSFADTYGIVRTEMWKVMAQLSGDAKTPALELSDKDLATLKKWLERDEG